MAYSQPSRYGILPYTADGHLTGRIRLSSFLIAAECGGLPALVWALRVLYGRYKRGGRISALIIMLLLSDLLELLLNPYIVIKLLQEENCWDTSTTCWILTSLWSGLKIYALHLQQLVALEGAFSIRHPPCSAHLFFPSCSIITSIITFIFFFLLELRSETLLKLLSLPLILAVTLTTCIVTCRAPPLIVNIPPSTNKPSCTALVLVSSTLILHAFVIMCIILGGHWDLWVVGVSLMSLRVMLDPLLCVLVSLRVQTPKARIDPNTVIELTQMQSSDPPNTARISSSSSSSLLFI